MFVEACAGPRDEDAFASPTRCRYLTIFIIAEEEKIKENGEDKNYTKEGFLSRSLSGRLVVKVACEAPDGFLRRGIETRGKRDIYTFAAVSSSDGFLLFISFRFTCR